MPAMIDFIPRYRLRVPLLLLLLSPATCFAMVCKTQGSGDVFVRDDLGSTVAIPATTPDGDIVWRSERHDVQVECVRDSQPSVAQEVLLYLNPDNLQVGQGIRAGLSLDGIDYVQSNGRISTRQILPVCQESESNLGACPTVSFNLSFSVFIQKFGPTPPSGVASNLLDYRLFQLDGIDGASALPANSLSYVINNLSGLRFIACEADLQVIPETIEFGSVGIQQVQIGRVIDQRPFSLATSRSCDSPFSLNARFKPVSGTLSGDYLIPANNQGVGIRIVKAQDSSPLRYNEPFHLLDMLDNTRAATAHFNAQLVWQSERPQAGPFEAEVMVDLFYK
jgi:hypothetical protein